MIRVVQRFVISISCSAVQYPNNIAFSRFSVETFRKELETQHIDYKMNFEGYFDQHILVILRVNFDPHDL